MKRDQIIKNLSLLIIEYEEGDVIRLGEIIDLLISLSGAVKRKKNIHGKVNPLLSHLRGYAQREIKKPGSQAFKENLSSGIDHITKLLDLSGNEVRDSYLEEEVDSLIEKVKDQSKQTDSQERPQAEASPQAEETQEDDVPAATPEIVTVFIAEAEDRLIQAQEMIFRIETNPEDEEAINTLFRAFHTLKGEAGFLKYPNLGELTHHLETLLDQIRNHILIPDAKIIECLFTGIDLCSEMISFIKEKGKDLVTCDLDEVIRDVRELSDKGVPPIGELLVKEQQLDESNVEEIIAEQRQSGFTKKFGEIAVEKNLLQEKDIQHTLDAQKEAIKKSPVKKLDPVIKVKASYINDLVDMVGELLIAESQLEDSNARQLQKVTRAIHGTAMKLRSTKVTCLFVNMTRVVRDLSLKLKKKVNFSKIGENIEIDRNMIESLNEPLMHILRNSVSHGIESEAEREEAGKDPIGNILLKVERRGNTIQFTIRDDGRGLNREKILHKAMAHDLISQENTESLSDKEIFRFIFHPGFSTAEMVDSVSGRGVGMDVVKTAIDYLRGRILIDSVEGAFTEIKLIFPLSVAIIDGMIVRCGNIHFVIPVEHIIETLSIHTTPVHSIEDKESVINLRGMVFPVIDLKKAFDIQWDQEEKRKLAVVIDFNDEKFALFVDQILSKREVVIKNLGEKFRHLHGISSGTVLPGGAIGYVLNIEDVVRIDA